MVRKSCNKQIVPITQERETSSQREYRIVHQDDGHYVLNTQSLHNASAIQAILPRAIRERRPLSLNAGEVWRTAVIKLASAAKQKSAQAQARKFARDMYKSALDDDDLGDTSVDDQDTGKRQKRRRRASVSSVMSSDFST